MPNSIKSIYRGLLVQQDAIAMACLDHHAHLDTFTRCHNFLGDLEKLGEISSLRPESVCTKSAGYEYQFALSSILIGQYRHAFASLRLTLELLVSGIYFSGHELHLRQWENGSRDINWGSLLDEENGVFCKPFVTAFHPYLDDLVPKYRALCSATYRECSEFVHGNPSRTRPLEGEIEFREELFNKWADTVESIKLISVFLYLFRYIEHVDEKSKEILECLSVDNLWHEEQVRSCFEED